MGEIIVCLNSPFSPPDAPQPSSGSVSVVKLNEPGKVRVTWRRRILGSGQVITGYSVQYRRKVTTSYTLTQCLALVQPHTPSPTSTLVQCMK